MKRALEAGKEQPSKKPLADPLTGHNRTFGLKTSAKSIQTSSSNHFHNIILIEYVKLSCQVRLEPILRLAALYHHSDHFCSVSETFSIIYT